MSTPSFEITDYTPLETLLLFHNLSIHGTHLTSFPFISNILVRNPLVKNGETFDRERLAPDALRELYLFQLKEAESELGNDHGQVNGDGGRPGSPVATRKRKAKTPPAALSNSDKTPLVKILTSRLYEQYRSTLFRQIRDDEKRFSQLERDIEDISTGLWDERLLKEKAPKARSRSSSATPRSSRDGRIASSSPGLERRNILPIGTIPEQSDKPLASSVSVEVSPRALPTPTPQNTIAQASTTPGRSPSQPLLPSRPTASPIKIEQPSPAPEISPQNVPPPAPISQQSPSPQIRDQTQEAREIYKATHPQTKREVIKAGLGQTNIDSPSNQTIMPWQGPNVQAVPASSPRQTQAHKALAAPIPSPQVPPKMEAVPPPPPPSTSSPVAPPLSRPLGVKIEAPVPPPTRTPFPPITPRPLQAAYPQHQASLARPSTMSVPAQQQLPGHQGLSGLLQLADVADTRRQQQHAPAYSPHGTPIYPHMYSPPGQQSPYGPAPITPHAQTSPQSHRTPTPSTPGGGNFTILFPTPASAAPVPPVQQYPQQYSPPSQTRSIVPQPTFQHYSSHVPAQQHNFEQIPQVPSPPVQRIAPRPPPSTTAVPLQPQVSPGKARPPPINTATSPQTPPHPQSASHRGEPGSPIPPRPDEISPISTPSRSPPPPASPKLPSIEKIRGTKRLFQEDEKTPSKKEKANWNKEDIKQQRTDRGREEKPAKRQKSMKHDKTPGKKDTTKGSSNTDKKPEMIPPASESKVKNEETEAMDIDSPTPASVSPEEEEPAPKPKARGRPRKTKPKPEEPVRVPEPQTKEKRPKRKRIEANAPTPQTIADDDDDSEVGAISISPTPHRRHAPKLEPQNSNAAMNIPSPSPLTVAIGQQPLVVATKKFLQLSAPLLGDISSHKFANLFSNAVNERMAPGYRNLVFRPQDLKSTARLRTTTLHYSRLLTFANNRHQSSCQIWHGGNY